MSGIAKSIGPNIGWKFYFDYFRSLDYQNKTPVLIPPNDVKTKNRGLTKNINWENYEGLLEEMIPAFGEQSFTLTTLYPGLLIGSGYHHEAGIKEEFKLGFFFDFTSGLPIIPGSSVKGVIRSVFEQGPDYVAGLIAELLSIDQPATASIKSLEVEIFGPEPGETLERNLSTQDIFYDAVITETIDNQILAEDTITPHKRPLADPIPIPFLKIVPGVTFRFDFSLQDSAVISELTKEKKAVLFQEILLTVGLGAKTNVGYGQFMKTQRFKAKYGFQNGDDEEITISPALIRKDKLDPYSTVTLYGKIIPSNPNDIKKGKPRQGINFFTTDAISIPNKRNKIFNDFEVDDWVRIEAKVNHNGQQVDTILSVEKIAKT